MPPGVLDLALYQGDDWKLDIMFTDGSNPVPITGWTWAAQVRNTTADADSGAAPAGTFTVATIDPATGHIRLTMPHTATTGLAAKAYRWDLEATVGGEVTTLLAGALTVSAEVTRAAP